MDFNVFITYISRKLFFRNYPIKKNVSDDNEYLFL